VATTSEGVKSVVETMLKESVDSVKGNSPGYTDISSDQLKEFINSLEHTTPSPLTPAVKTADLWAWMDEPANMAMLGVMFLCGMNEICCSIYYFIFNWWNLIFSLS
jgi:hypothetical protein